MLSLHLKQTSSAFPEFAKLKQQHKDKENAERKLCRLSWGIKISGGLLISDPCRSISGLPCAPAATGEGQKTCVTKSVF